MTASYRTGIIICFLCISLPHKGYSQLSMASKEAEFVRLYAALQNSYGSGADSTETYSEKFSSSFTGFAIVMGFAVLFSTDIHFTINGMPSYNS